MEKNNEYDLIKTDPECDCQSFFDNSNKLWVQNECVEGRGWGRRESECFWS